MLVLSLQSLVWRHVFNLRCVHSCEEVYLDTFRMLVGRRAHTDSTFFR